MNSDDLKALKTSDPEHGWRLDRRDFLKLVGSGIVVFFTVGGLPIETAEAQRRNPYPSDPNAYLRIDENGKVTVFTGKIEMGQGVVTSLAQMAAEELGVSLDTIEMVMGDTDLCPWDMGTFGSLTTRFFGPALRAAACEARNVLLDLAAEQLKAPREELRVENGVVFSKGDPRKRVGFGELAKGRQIFHETKRKVAFTPVDEFEVMGKDTLRRDAHEKVTGKALYAADMRVPGMVYAKILRPPAHDAVLKSADTTAAEKWAGAQVVREKDLIAVLHSDPEQAARALKTIEAKYDRPEPQVDDSTIFDHLLEHAGEPERREARGDLAAGERVAQSILQERYLDGYCAHAPMEPHAALAHLKDGKLTVWASTQTPFPTQAKIAKIVGMPKEKVRVITPFVGGGFGGKTVGLQAEEAARLAVITGLPVQVAYDRAEEFFYDAFHSAAVIEVRSGVDASGKICLWDYSVYAAGSRSTEQYYDVPNNLVKIYGANRGAGASVHPFAVGPWRAPGANTNTFARESQIDIMAAQLQMDPLEFRLNNTSDPRMRKVLETAAKSFGWKQGVSPSGRGWGIACGIDAGTYVALIAAVEVDEQSGQIKVRRLVCAQDMGIVVNPEGAIIQMEGCLTMGLGYALSETIRFQGGQILDENFDTYELPRFSTLPEIETVLVENDELSPQGGGEPAIIGVGAAIANAVFDASSLRLRRMPMTAERVRAALTKKG